MIFYFSGTGNTKWAAYRIASATHDNLVDIAEEMRLMKANGKAGCRTYTLKEGERVGFVFPVHGWRVPRLVRNFIALLRIVPATGNTADSTPMVSPSSTPTNNTPHTPFAYAVCTAGDSIGLTIENLDRCIASNDSLAAMGIRKVASAYSLIMPESYVGLPFMDVDPKEKERRKKDKASHDLDEYLANIIDRKEGVFRLTKGFWPWMMTQVVGGFFEHVLITDKRFHVTQDKCVKCGICANVCPVNDIDGGKGKYPTWKHNPDCLTCFCCYHHCPHHAIEFGHQTQKKGQYYYR